VGSARSFGDLLKEIGLGETVLKEKDGKLIRMVEIVIVFVFNKKGEWLVEKPQHFVDGRTRSRRFPYISETLRLGEHPVDTAVRAVKEETAGHVTARKDQLIEGEITDLTLDHPYNTGSTSYPGLASVKKAYTFAYFIGRGEYKKEYVEVDGSGTITVHTWKPGRYPRTALIPFAWAGHYNHTSSFACPESFFF
ncbi:MAG: hypothetical protein ACP5D3_09190, partial [Sulfurovum sp.]